MSSHADPAVALAELRERSGLSVCFFACPHPGEGEVLAFEHGRRLSAALANALALAARLVEERQHDCIVAKWSSRVCACGTKSCIRKHSVVPVEQFLALQAAEDAGIARNQELQERLAVLEAERDMWKQQSRKEVEFQADKCERIIELESQLAAMGRVVEAATKHALPIIEQACKKFPNERWLALARDELRDALALLTPQEEK